MSKKTDGAPEKYSNRWVVYFTDEQLAAVTENARRAGIELGPFLREAALGYVAKRKGSDAFIDNLRESRIKGALDDAVSLNFRILDLIALDDIPAPDEWKLAASKMEMVNQRLLEFLEGL